MPRYLLASLFVLAAILCEPVAAQGEEQPLRIELYPIADIVYQVADYPRDDADGFRRGTSIGGGGGGFGGGGGGGGAFQFSHDHGLPDRRTGSSSITVDELVAVIESLIAPGTWESSDGRGRIHVVGTAMVVQHDDDTHKAIAKFLAQLRNANSRRTVSIEAQWLLLDSRELEQLSGEADTDGGPLAVDVDALSKFTRRGTSLRGSTNCFSGQRVYVVSGSKRTIVKGVVPVVGSTFDTDAAGRLADRHPQPSPSWKAGRLRVSTVAFREEEELHDISVRQAAVGFQPIVEEVVMGVRLEVRPTLVGNGETAIVDLKSTISSLRTGASDMPQPIPHQSMPEIDRVPIETAELATTLEVPLGKAVLVGGLTQDPSDRSESPDDNASDASERPQMYLVIKVR